MHLDKYFIWRQKPSGCVIPLFVNHERLLLSLEPRNEIFYGKRTVDQKGFPNRRLARDKVGEFRECDVVLEHLGKLGEDLVCANSSPFMDFFLQTTRARRELDQAAGKFRPRN